MVVAAENGHNTNYACKCLNVRINSTPPPHSPETADPDYTSVFVGDEGIAVVHTQLTFRIRSRAKQNTQGDTIELTRYASLTCLICRTLVYRVFQVISPDVDTAEGPVTPTEEWAERELLKSTSGWIEVYKDRLTGEAIKQAETSISSLYGVILPSDPPLSSIANPQYPSHSSSSSPSSSMTPSHHLPALPPLYLPPPFTPTHPIFRHISSIASNESTKLREEAEVYLRKVVQEKVAELEAAELKLKQEVELLWINYKQFISEVAPSVKGHRGNTGSSRPHQSSMSISGPISSGTGPVLNGTSASIRISEFVPAPSHPRRSPTPAHRSALSTSLATTSFHHPAAHAETHWRTSNGLSPPPYSSNSPSPDRSSATRASSPVTASSRTLAVAIDGAASIRDAYRRNMDESIDIATSFKYVSDLEAEMEGQRERGRAREREVEVSPPDQPTTSNASTAPRERSPRTSKSAIKKPSKTNGSSTSPSTRGSTSGEGDKINETPTKGKRKVTFDVKPDVAIISTDGPVHKLDDSRPEQEAVFDMENERDDQDLSNPTSPPLSLPTTPTVEPVRPHVRHHRNRSTNMSGLPSSLSALRPASLPVPSAIRSSMSREQSEERPRSEIVRESLLQGDTKGWDVKDYRELVNVNEDSSDPREAEILRLVAASTPSHRNAWKKDSRAWRVFVSRQGPNSKGVESSIAEEEEDSTAESNNSRDGYYDESEDDTSGLEDEPTHRLDIQIAHSLPVAITPLSEHRRKFGVPFLQPKTSLSDRPGIMVPPLHRTSEAFKRASYAERDRARSVDPGTLDFTADEDECEEDDEVNESVEAGGKGRQRALKILEARSEVPAEGMWRSLA